MMTTAGVGSIETGEERTPSPTSKSEQVASGVLHGDALEAYEAAVERARLARQAWDELGRPLLTSGSRKQDVPHPLLKVIRDAELLADRLRLGVRPARMGRPPVAVVRPGTARITRVK